MHVIRKATKKDIASVFSIYKDLMIDHSKTGNKDYIEQIEQNGFIVSQETEEDFAKHLQKAKAFYVFLVEETYGGFIIVNDDFAKTDHNRVWYDEKLKSELYSPKSLFMHVLGIHPAFTHLGAATELLKAAEKRAKKGGYTHLVSIVPTRPYENKASIAFHQSNGFIKAAGSKEAIHHADLDGYEYLVYAKEI